MGPKNCLVLATVCDVPENYKNIKKNLDLINVNEIEFKLSTHLKLVNMICGKQSASAKFPCCYGHCYKDKNGKWVPGELTRFSDLKSQHQLYKTQGDRKRKRKINAAQKL